MFSIGAVKTALSRVSGYISYVNFGLLYMNTVKIFTLTFPESLMLGGGFLIIGLIITMIDFKYIFSQEQRFQMDKNPVMDEIRQSLRRIEDKL